MALVTIHLSILIVTAAMVFVADHLGFAYMRGSRSVLPRGPILTLHYVVSAGLVGMIATGIALVLPMWEYTLQDPVFYLKMFFVLCLVFNAWVIKNVSTHAIQTPFALLAPNIKHFMMVSGSVSFVSWVGAACTGFFFL